MGSSRHLSKRVHTDPKKHSHGSQVSCILGRNRRVYGWNPTGNGQEISKSMRCSMSKLLCTRLRSSLLCASRSTTTTMPSSLRHPVCPSMPTSLLPTEEALEINLASYTTCILLLGMVLPFCCRSPSVHSTKTMINYFHRVFS